MRTPCAAATPGALVARCNSRQDRLRPAVRLTSVSSVVCCGACQVCGFLALGVERGKEDVAVSHRQRLNPSDTEARGKTGATGAIVVPTVHAPLVQGASFGRDPGRVRGDRSLCPVPHYRYHLRQFVRLCLDPPNLMDSGLRIARAARGYYESTSSPSASSVRCPGRCLFIFNAASKETLRPFATTSVALLLINSL